MIFTKKLLQFIIQNNESTRKSVILLQKLKEINNGIDLVVKKEQLFRDYDLHKEETQDASTHIVYNPLTPKIVKDLEPRTGLNDKPIVFILSSDIIDLWNENTEIGIFIGSIYLDIEKKFIIQYANLQTGNRIINGNYHYTQNTDVLQDNDYILANSLWRDGIYLFMIDIDVDNLLQEETCNMIKYEKCIDIFEIYNGRIYKNIMLNDSAFCDV